MKKYLLILLVWILSAGVQAELVDGPANIREQPNGKILFSIKDNVPVDYSFYQDDWYSITLTASIQEARFSMDSGILKDTILYDLNGNEIGRALDNIPISKERITYNQESHTYKCILEGYTFKNNLKDNISTVSIAERINAPNKKCGVLIDIAKSCIQMNQKDNADKILAELLVTTDTIGINPNYIGNSYDENDEKAYKLRDIALLYFQMGKKQKAIEILDNAVIEARNIKGACDQYLYRDKAWEDFAFDFIDFGEYELGIKTIQLTGGTFADRALSEVINKYLANNDITTAKKTVDLIKNKNIKEQALVNISLKDVNLNNINTHIKLIKSLKEEPIKCLGLAQLAVKYFNLKGDGNKITSDLLNESFEIAKRIKNHYQRDGLLAEIAGRYAEVKQFEKAKALALKIEWSISKARGLMNIAIQYAEIDHRGQAENLLDQAWNITGKSDEGLDQEEMFQAMIIAYCECGLINKIVSRIKSFGNIHSGVLLTISFWYNKNKQPEAALNLLKDFEKKQPDQVKAWVIGEVINQSIISNHEQAMRILAGATEILDSIADRDWKYLNTIKTEDYSKIALKYIELQQNDQAIQIIDQKFPDYDDKVSVAVKAILMYNKVNTEINEGREEFINRVSNLTVHNELKVIR